MNQVSETNFRFEGQKSYYKGKVREVYHVNDKMVMIASDRISAFDYILPRTIPFKGQVLNKIAAHFLEASAELVPNWLEDVPHPNVAIGKACVPIKLEMVIRGYLAGHAWRTYKEGIRLLCGVELPEGMKEGDKFPEPIITPATKADEGHDEDISAEEILQRKIVSPREWETLCHYTRTLFEIGTKMAAERGLILVDTKYEFGYYNDDIILMDEIHTPDSSRYYITEGYLERQKRGEKQVQLSKEFVREWLMEQGFQGKEGQELPYMPDEFVNLISERYIGLYEKITGKPFEKKQSDHILEDMHQAILNAL